MPKRPSTHRRVRIGTPGLHAIAWQNALRPLPLGRGAVRRPQCRIAGARPMPMCVRVSAGAGLLRRACPNNIRANATDAFLIQTEFRDGVDGRGELGDDLAERADAGVTENSGVGGYD